MGGDDIDWIITGELDARGAGVALGGFTIILLVLERISYPGSAASKSPPKDGSVSSSWYLRKKKNAKNAKNQASFKRAKINHSNGHSCSPKCILVEPCRLDIVFEYSKNHLV